MFRWAITFLLIVLAVVLFGFTGLSHTASGVAELLFFALVGISAEMLIVGVALGRRVTV